jgi:Mrp family chromosome partitioning ATPase
MASEAIVYIEPLNLYHISSGSATASPINLLQKRSLHDVLDGVEQDFEWVILDSPPIGAFADALALAAQVDGVILVTRSGSTRRRDLETCLASLKDCRVIGVVLNAFDGNRKSQSYYDTYYGNQKRAPGVREQMQK